MLIAGSPCAPSGSSAERSTHDMGRGGSSGAVRAAAPLFARRQLSEELLAARGALEKESQLREQARREKEELLYRVLNGGDGSPFPIAAGDVPLIAT